MSRRRVSNPLALAVLCCLIEGPKHPYEISTTLRTRGKEQSIKLNYGSLYSVVESLQKHGLIRPRETVREGRRPERTVYEITDAGITECEDWLAELLSTPVREFTSLEAGLSLMPTLRPSEVLELLELRAERLRIERRSIEAAHAEGEAIHLPELFMVESRYRRAMLDAELQFVTALAVSIKDGTLQGLSGWYRVHELRDEGVTLEEMMADPLRYFGEEGRLLLREFNNSNAD
ncbi:MAG TPA: PadR family transcriptional regulator [Acidimicrobiales bacterium]|nr:PadR family transcriptional regulator [Acidimicrobiales bacterium]